MTRTLKLEGRKAELRMWQYILTLIELLNTDGMLDEEDSTKGLGEQVKFKNILVLCWHHPFIVKLFQMVDNVRGVEAEIFNIIDRPKLKRICGQKYSSHPPAKKLPLAVYNNEYISSLNCAVYDGLQIDEESEFKMFEVGIDGVQFKG